MVKNELKTAPPGLQEQLLGLGAITEYIPGYVASRDGFRLLAYRSVELQDQCAQLVGPFEGQWQLHNYS